MLEKIKSLYKNKAIRLAILVVVLTAVFGYSGGRFYIVKAFNSRVNIFPGSFAVEQIDNDLVWENIEKSFYQDLSGTAEGEEFIKENSAFILSAKSLEIYKAEPEFAPAVSEEETVDDSAPADLQEEIQDEGINEAELKEPEENDDLIEETILPEEIGEDAGSESGKELTPEIIPLEADESPEPTGDPEPVENKDDVSLFDRVIQGINGFISYTKELDIFGFKLARAQDDSADFVEPKAQYTLLNQNIIFSDFSVPIEYTENNLAQINLRLSLAAYSEYINDHILLEYSINNEWHSLDEISLNERISNRLNNDYLLYDLSENMNWEDLDDLKVKVNYLNNDLVSDEDDKELEIFLDAIWLEVDYNDPAMETENISEGKVLGAEEESENNKKYEFKLLSDKTDFESSEMPNFNFRIQKKENLLQQLLTEITQTFRDEYKILSMSAKLLNEDGSEYEDAALRVNYLKDGEFEVKYDKLLRKFKPGKNKIIISVREGTEQYIFSQDFTWGVLALNTNKSIYSPKEDAYLQMAVLDDNGNTLCAVNALTLEIRDPIGQISYLTLDNGKIIANPECGPNNVIDSPDFYGYYRLDVPGRYELILKADTDNGEREISDFIEVHEAVPIAIERIGPTRIYPLARYAMRFNITPTIDFEGEFKEIVPNVFIVKAPSGRITSGQEGENIISWQVDWSAGRTYELSYVFDAPDISPEFYLLGPAKAGGRGTFLLADSLIKEALIQKEIRQWQIASDDLTILFTKDSTTANDYNTTEETLLSLSGFDSGETYIIFGGVGSSRYDGASNRNEIGLSIQANETHLPNLNEFVEGPRSDDGASVFMMGKREWDTETLYLRADSTATADAEDYFLMAMATSTMGTYGQDYFWNDHINTADLPANPTFSEYASTTFLSDGSSEYLVIGVMEAAVDADSQWIEMDIYNGSASMVEHVRDAEDIADTIQLFAATSTRPTAGTTTISIRGRASAGTTGDHLSSRILIIRMNYYKDWSCSGSSAAGAINTAPAVINSTSLQLSSPGDVVALYYGAFSSTDIGSGVSARARFDSTVQYQITEDDPNNGPGRIHVWNTTDVHPTLWFDEITVSDTDSHTYDFSYERQSVIGASYEQSLICVWGKAPAEDVSVSATGTQIFSILIPTSNVEMNAKFVLTDNTGSHNINSIIITENGTIDAGEYLENVRLYYELDTTAPYDCAGESYGGSEEQYGATSTGGFSSANGTAVFSETVGISTTSTMCVYTVLDVIVGAADNSTLEIKIDDPVNEVDINIGIVGPSTGVDLPGTTQLTAPAVTAIVDEQRKSDNSTLISNTNWTDENEVYLSAFAYSSISATTSEFDYYFELLTENGTYTTATTVPAGPCVSGTAYGSCGSNIWTGIASATSWYDTNWVYRKKITIFASQVVATADDFVVLATTTDANLAYTSNGGHMASSSGADMLIADAFGNKLDYEREYYSSSTGEIAIWIQLDISSTTNQEIYLYYGNSTVSKDQATTTGVWDSSYKAVWHLAESGTGAAGEYLDSTVNSYHGQGGTSVGGDNCDPPTRVSGLAGYGQSFDGDSDNFGLTPDVGLDVFGSDFTLEAWTLLDTTDNGVILDALPGPNTRLNFSHDGADGWTYNSRSGTIATYIVESANTTDINEYHHIVYTRSGNDYIVYLDGAVLATNTNAIAPPADSDWSFGHRRESRMSLTGDLDEIRVLSVARTQEWIQTEFNNQSNVNSFMSFGNEESSGIALTAGEANISGIPDRGTVAGQGYKWQVLACNDNDYCSNWARFNSTLPNFKVDDTSPTAPGNLVLATTTATTIRLDFGSQSSDDNFDRYRMFYKVGISEVSQNDIEHNDSNLLSADYSSATSTLITNLDSATTYVINIWAYDDAGNYTSASEIVVTTASAPHARARSVQFLAGNYSANGSSGQLSNTNQTFNAFALELAETEAQIRNAYLIFETQFEAYHVNSGDYIGYELAFDVCEEPCSADAFFGTGRILTDDNTALVYNEAGGNQARILMDVTSEAELFAYKGDGADLEAQIGYRLETDTATTSIAGAKAILVVTYSFNDDNSSNYTNTVIYPLESTASGDSGTRRASTTDNCIKTPDGSANCPIFNYNMNIPEFNAKLSQWFEIFGVNDLHGANDVLANVNIEGVNINSNSFYHEAANNGEQSNLPRLIFNNVSGFSESTAQALEAYFFGQGSGRYYLLGGEVIETYTAAKSAGTKTRTVSFPIGALTNGQSMSTASSSVDVYFPENGSGVGVVNIEKAWLRIVSNNYNSGDRTLTVSSKVGDNTQSSNYIYDLNTGTDVINPVYRVVHIIPGGDYSELESANAASPKAVTAYTTNSSLEQGGVSVELMITYTYTDESSGYLSALSLYGGQSDVNGNSQNDIETIANLVFPELRGDETIRAAGLTTSYLFSDSDGDMPGVWFSLGSNIATSSPICTSTYYHRSDGINSFGEMIENVSSVLSANDNESYSACYSNANGSSLTAGAKMNAILNYVYQWDAPPPVLTQNDWRWYEEEDGVTPDTPLADENAVISNVNIGDNARLRMNIGVSSDNMATSTQTFKLQYATTSDCTSASEWTDVGGLAGNLPWRGYNNPDPIDGATLDSVLLSSSTRSESYEEENPSAGNPRGVVVGGFGEWDWTLYNNSATSSQSYCFRMVFSDGTALNDYLSDSYPKLTTAPDNSSSEDPDSLGQYRNDDQSVISNSGWINTDTIDLNAKATDPNLNEIITLYFEIASTSDSFTTATSAPSQACLSGTNWNSCLSKVWAASSTAGDYRTVPFSGTTTIAGLPDYAVGYKWQVLACDDSGECSDWVKYNLTTPNFKVDTVAPDAPGNMIFATSTPTSITLALGASTTEDNFYRYQVFYRAGIFGVNENDDEHADNNFNFQDYNSATSTLVINLSANTEYVFNIWAYDLAGNSASATVEVVGTTTSAFNPPTGFISSVDQRTDGSGIVDVIILVNDPDNDDQVRARIMYVSGGSCDLTAPLDPSLDETGANIWATYGDPDIDNDHYYQVGTSTSWIITSPGQNYVFFDWQAYLDEPDANGDYCLGLVVNDGGFDQVATHTLDFTLDNVDPAIPGNLTFDSKSYNSVTLDFSTSSSDTNFDQYIIYYKKGISGVSETDTPFDKDDDSNLDFVNYGTAATTTIIGLDPDTDYVFNIWAYDVYGNATSALVELTAKTNAQPVNISADEQYLDDGFTVISNNTWINENNVILQASAHDQDATDSITFYYEVLTATGTFSIATSAPGDYCAYSTAYLSCDNNIWGVSTSTSNLPSDWYSEDWLFRKAITINSSQVATSVGAMPILATTTDADLAARARSDAYDILFTDSDGITKIPYEREYYNSGTGELTAWIKTAVSSTTDKVIYMYYGNAASDTDQATTTGVWDIGYAGAWHLSENVVDESSWVNAHLDSGTYGNDGDQYGNNEMPGQIYRGQEFDGIDDYIDIGNTNNTINGAAFWIKADSLTQDIMDFDNGTHTIALTNGVLSAPGFVSPTFYVDGIATTTLDTGWHHVIAATDTGFSASDFDIGRINTSYFDGLIDEVRLLSVSRGIGWASTQANNQRDVDSFLGFGSEELAISFYETMLVITVPDNPDYASGYKWQAMACDDDNDCTVWDEFNSTTPNFKIDTTLPGAPGQLSEDSKTSNTITLAYGAAANEDNFVEYKIYYSTTSPVFETDIEHNDSDLGDQYYNSATDTTVTGLNPDTTYYFNIWAYDIVGHTTSSTPVSITTNNAQSSPGAAFYTKNTRVLYYRVWDGVNWGAEQAGPTLGSDVGDNIRHIRTQRSDDGGKVGILIKTWDGTNQEWWGAVYRYAANDFISASSLGSAQSSTTNNQLLTACIAALSDDEFIVVRNNNASDGTLIFSWNGTDEWVNEGAGPNPSAVMNGCALERRPGTDNYLLLTFDDDGDTGTAYYYGGSSYTDSWTVWSQHSGDEEDIDNYVGQAFFDPSDNTQGAFSYSNSTVNNYAYAKYFLCDNTSINFGAPVAGPGSAPDDWGNDFVHGEFAPDPTSSGLAYYAGRDIGGELNVYQVDASDSSIGWATTTNGDNISAGDLYSETNDSQKPFAIEFYKGGHGVVVGLNNTGASLPYYSTISTAGSSLSATSSVENATNDVWTRVRLYNDPNEDELLAIFQNDNTDYITAFWDGGNDQFYAAGTQAWTELATSTGAASQNDENISFAYTKNNSAPDLPTGLGQYKNDGLTDIANQAWTNASTTQFVASITDADTSEIITYYLQLLPNNDTFATTTAELSNACGSSTPFNSCNSKIWAIASSTPGDYSTEPYTATATIGYIPDSTIGYKWQVIACDDSSACSSWALFNATAPNFYVDTTAPTAPGELIDIQVTGNSITLQFGATSTETNFDRYQIHYATNSSVQLSDTEHSDSDLTNKLFNYTTQTIVNNLASNTLYYFNIWAFDLAGNRATATPEISTTTNIGPRLAQISYLLENDDGVNVNSNTADVASNTPLNNINIGERINARLQLENFGGDIMSNKVYQLQYENQTDDPGNWYNVGAATEISHSPGLSGAVNGQAITLSKAAANANQWNDGTWHEDTGQIGSYSLTEQYYTEFVFAIETGNAATNTAYRLRLYNLTDSEELETYTNYAVINTIVSESKRYSKEINGSLPTDTNDLNYYLDPEGYADVFSDDNVNRDELTSSANYAIYNFATKHTNSTEAASSTWNGRSTIAPFSNNVVLQAYRFGTTNAWVTLDTENAAGAGADFDLTATLNSNLSEYYNGGNWIYWRVYQVSGTQTLRTDYFNINYSAPIPYVEQIHYRWRNDDGTELNATWLEDEDTGNPTLGNALSKGSSTRLRFAVVNTGGGEATTYQYQIEYASSSDGCSTDPGNWETVPITATTEHFEMATSTYFNDGEATTATTTNSENYTFIAGDMVADSSNTSGQISLSEGRYTELEYIMLVTINADTGGTYCFRVTNNSSVLNNYDTYPVVTLAGNTNNAPGFDAHPSDNNSASTSPTNYGADISFTATASDDEHSYYLAICKTNSITPGNDGPPICAGGAWCTSTLTASANEAGCNYTTATTSEMLDWWGFACDKAAGFGVAKCSSGSQGSGDIFDDSPFVINHPPDLTQASTTENNKDPGETYTITASVTDADTAGGADTMDLFVCSQNSAVAGVGCAGVGNIELCSESATSSPNASCPFSTSSPAIAGTYTYYAFVFDSHGLAASPASRSGTYTVNNVAPNLGTLLLNNGSGITLNIKGAGDISISAVNASIEDENGCNDLVSAVGRIYMSNAANGFNCAADNNDCYHIDTASCVISGCAGGTDKTAVITCAAGMKYYAIPTTEDKSGSNPWKDYNWLSYMQVYDGSNYSATTSAGVEVGISLALNVEEGAIDFGSEMEEGDNSGTDNSTTTIENAGNCPIDTNISGTDMIGNPSGTIDVENIKWHTDNFNYTLEGTALTESDDLVDIAAPRATTSSDVEDRIYWGISIPHEANSSTYNGQNDFQVLLDVDNW
ncbi:DUF2341 domain-containing protein [Candidatus Parcubacteria bacterium]|nr:DUF2341 domain-containing protein [Candidatus Parcubacteria bacterium]